MISQDQKGELLSTIIVTCRGGNDGLPFKCMQGHDFKISIPRLETGDLKPLSQEDWCLKCRNFQKKALKKIQESEYKLMSSEQVISEIVVKCKEGHIFKLTTEDEGVFGVTEICQKCYVEKEKLRKTILEEKALKEERDAKER